MHSVFKILSKVGENGLRSNVDGLEVLGLGQHSCQDHLELVSSGFQGCIMTVGLSRIVTGLMHVDGHRSDGVSLLIWER